MTTGDYQGPHVEACSVTVTRAGQVPLPLSLMSRERSGHGSGRPGSVTPAAAAMRSPFRFWYVP
jgi:hypothetical protein